MTEEEELRHKNWTSFLAHTRERTMYAVKRIDLLIISICGAGIYIIFESFKAITKKELPADNVWILKAAGIGFLIAIIVNFISQRTGYHANDYREKYTILEIHSIEGNKVDKGTQTNHDEKAKSFTKWTNIFNFWSVVLMSIGLALLVIFNYSLF